MHKAEVGPEMNRRRLLASVAGMGALHLAKGIPMVHAVSTDKDGPIAVTEYGKILGVSGQKVLSFRGIPYGGPTAGSGRFMPPTKPVAWKGVRNATQAGPRAIQATNDPVIGDKNIFSSPLIGFYFSGGRTDAPEITYEPQSENCLVLNVLTPGLTGKRPVMVYIHGGGFTQGSAALTLISDRFVAEENVVLVGVNHRLNVFGYSYLGGIDPKFADSGNVGQMDLVQALEWVKANIAHFGGDSSNVTIFGESGGGAKISCLMAMPSAKGLFRRAIVQSGSAGSVGSTESATTNSKTMLAVLGVSTIEELQKVPAEKLLAAGRRNSPVMDGRSVPHQTWQPGAPPEAAGVALLVGNCKDEATLFQLKNTELYQLSWEQLIEQMIKVGMPTDTAKTIMQKYHGDYPQESPSDVYFRMAADRGARTNALGQADAKLAQGSGDVYMYHFSWDTPLDNGKLRAFHTSDLPLEMRLVAFPQAEELSKQLSGAWAGFARTGDPNHSGLPHWNKYSAEKQSTMVFDVGKTACVDHFNQEELSLLRPYASGTL